MTGTASSSEHRSPPWQIALVLVGLLGCAVGALSLAARQTEEGARVGDESRRQIAALETHRAQLLDTLLNLSAQLEDALERDEIDPASLQEQFQGQTSGDLARLAEDLRAAPPSASTASAARRVGELLRRMNHEGAAVAFRAACDAYQQLAAPDATDGRGLSRDEALDFADAAASLGQLLAVGEPNEAAEWLNAAQHTATRLLAVEPNLPQALTALALAHAGTARLAEQAGDLDACLAEYAAARDAWKRLKLAPDDVAPRLQFGRILLDAGAAAADAGERETALSFFQDAVATGETLFTAAPDHAVAREQLHDAHQWLGELFVKRQELRKGLDHLELAWPLLEDMVGADEDDSYALGRRAASLKRLAVLSARLGREGDAQRFGQTEAALLRRLTELTRGTVEAAYDLSDYHHTLGLFYEALPDYAAAREAFLADLKLLEDLADDAGADGSDQQRLAEGYLDLARLEAATGESAQAQDWRRKALRVLERTLSDPATAKLPDLHEALRSLRDEVRQQVGDDA